MPATSTQSGGAAAWSVLLLGTMVLVTTSVVYLQTRTPTTVVVLGPAEAAKNGQPNPGLSAAGLERARELVRVIGDLPITGSVAAVFATRYRVSQETAEPIARHLDLPVQLVDSANHGPLLRRVASEYRGQLLVVVTDADAMPGLIKRLLGGTVIGDDEHNHPDRLYLVTMPRVGAGRAVALRYGASATVVAGS